MLWILAEEKDCGAANFFLPISCHNEVFVTVEIFQRTFSITNFSSVFSDKIQINVIHAVYDTGVHAGRGNTIIKWSAKQFIDVRFLTVNAGKGRQAQ